MKLDFKIAWLVVAFGFALGLLAGFDGCCRVAWAAPPTLLERIETEIERQQRGRREPSVEPSQLAVAIRHATPSREWAALLLTTAVHESGTSAAIAEGRCGPHQCDGGRAWGLWQVHRTTRNGSYWGSVDLNVQAAEASHLLRGAFYQCKNSGVPFPLSTIRAYAGRGCTGELPGEQQRVATYQRILNHI